MSETKNQHETFYLIFNRKKMKYPPFISDKCLADHKSGFQPLYRSAKHLCLSALFIAPRNKNSLIFSHKTSSVFLKKRFGLLKSDRSACEPHRHKLAPARKPPRSKVVSQIIVYLFACPSFANKIILAQLKLSAKMAFALRTNQRSITTFFES